MSETVANSRGILDPLRQGAWETTCEQYPDSFQTKVTMHVEIQRDITSIGAPTEYDVAYVFVDSIEEDKMIFRLVDEIVWRYCHDRNIREPERKAGEITRGDLL